MSTKQFQQAIGTAAWNLDLWKFCQIMGIDPMSDYGKQKFRDFQELAGKLGQFDSATLAKIIDLPE